MPSSILLQGDCEKIVNSYYKGANSWKIVNYEVSTHPNAENGLLSDCFSIKICVDKKGQTEQLSFFAKAISPINEGYAKSARIFEKETFFYNYIQSACNELNVDMDFVPKFFGVINNKYIVLEDLFGKWHAYKDRFLDENHIKVVLKSVAKLHTVSVLFEEKRRRFNKEYSIYEEFQDLFEEPLFPEDPNCLGYAFMQSAVKAVHSIIDLKLDQNHNQNSLKERLLNISKNLWTLSKPSPRYMNVLCHGDLWVNNLLFKYENGIPIKCLLIDFQLIRYTPPAFDVLKLIFSTSPVDDVKNYHDYLQTYYELFNLEMEKHNYDLAEKVSREEFEVSCKRMVPAIKYLETCYLTLNAVPMDLPEEVLNKYYYEDRSECVLKMWEENPEFAKHMSFKLKELYPLTNENIIIIKEDCFRILNQQFPRRNYQLLDFELKTELSGQDLILFIKINANDKCKVLKYRVETFKDNSKNKLNAIASKWVLNLAGDVVVIDLNNRE